jgi:hypothetical protein
MTLNGCDTLENAVLNRGEASVAATVHHPLSILFCDRAMWTKDCAPAVGLVHGSTDVGVCFNFLSPCIF